MKKIHRNPGNTMVNFLPNHLFLSIFLHCFDYTVSRVGAWYSSQDSAWDTFISYCSAWMQGLPLLLHSAKEQLGSQQVTDSSRTWVPSPHGRPGLSSGFSPRCYEHLENESLDGRLSLSLSLLAPPSLPLSLCLSFP